MCTFSLFQSTAAVTTSVKSALAAYGDSANVFGSKTNASGFLPYAGDGYALLIPSKYNPSQEKEFPGVDLSCVFSYLHSFMQK